MDTLYRIWIRFPLKSHVVSENNGNITDNGKQKILQSLAYNLKAAIQFENKKICPSDERGTWILHRNEKEKRMYNSRKQSDYSDEEKDIFPCLPNLRTCCIIKLNY